MESLVTAIAMILGDEQNFIPLYKAQKLVYYYIGIMVWARKITEMTVKEISLTRPPSWAFSLVLSYVKYIIWLTPFRLYLVVVPFLEWKITKLHMMYAKYIQIRKIKKYNSCNFFFAAKSSNLAKKIHKNVISVNEVFLPSSDDKDFFSV